MADLSIIKELRLSYDNLEEKELTFPLKTMDIKFKLKEYIPMETKLSIATSCLELSIMDVESENISTVDTTFCKIVRDYLLVAEYTDIPLTDDIMESYNLLDSCGLLDFVLENIPEKEAIFVDKTISSKINEYYSLRQLTNDLGYKLEGIVDAINGDLAFNMDKLKDLKLDEIVAQQKVIEQNNKKIKKQENKLKDK